MNLSESNGVCKRCERTRLGKEVWFWVGRVEHTQIEGLKWTMTIHPLDSVQCFICHVCNRRARAKYALSDNDNLIESSASSCGCAVLLAAVVGLFLYGEPSSLLFGIALAIGFTLVFALPAWIKDSWRDRSGSPLSARTQTGFAELESELYEKYSPDYWSWKSTEFAQRPTHSQYELGTGSLRIMTGDEVPD